MEYLHGGNVFLASRELGIPVEEIIDFSASINPLGLPQKVKNVLRENIDLLVHYPDTECTALRETIAEVYDINAESIIIGNGSTELIYLIPRVLRPQGVLIPAPAFSEYERAINRVQGTGHRAQNTEYRIQSTEYRTEIRYLFLKEENDFKINVDKFINAMQGCDMAFLCNPNNPTGSLMRRHEVMKIAEEAKRQGCFLVVDEAFIDFVPEESVIKEVSHNPHLIVLRSMTKFYALAGLRLGYGVFHRGLVNEINRYRGPWTVNALAQMAGIAAFQDTLYVKKTMDLMRHEKKFLEDSFKQMNIRFFPSRVNYYLLKIQGADRIVEDMMKKGVLLRHCANFKGLDNSYIRVAVRRRKENKRLLNSLRVLLKYSSNKERR